VHLTDGQTILRLCLSVAVCALIGLEREWRGHPAGLRTHALVGLGATLFTLAGAYGFAGFHTTDSPTRVAAQVVTGVGFLGAGTILRRRRDVHGLTTAASLWLAAAVGVAVGSGLVFVTLIASALALIVLLAAQVTHPLVRDRHNVHVQIHFAAGTDNFGRILLGLSESFAVEDLRIEREGAEVLATFKADGHRETMTAILAAVHGLPEIRLVTVDGKSPIA
jgi:putative Mg2+ transporter-C (MgtC) family protein